MYLNKLIALHKLYTGLGWTPRLIWSDKHPQRAFIEKNKTNPFRIDQSYSEHLPFYHIMFLYGCDFYSISGRTYVRYADYFIVCFCIGYFLLPVRPYLPDEAGGEKSFFVWTTNIWAEWWWWSRRRQRRTRCRRWWRRWRQRQAGNKPTQQIVRIRLQ